MRDQQNTGSDASEANLTLLMTDIEGSTHLWEEFPAAMAAALVRHDSIMREIIVSGGGAVVKSRGEGDSVFAAFHDADAAVDTAIELQRALQSEAWPGSLVVRVRMALHSGIVEARDGDYFGPTVNRCARIRALAHGGQIIASQATIDAARASKGREIATLDLGSHLLRDVRMPEKLFQLIDDDLPSDFPATRSLDRLPTNLPVSATTFVGRQSEVPEIERLLFESRILTLTGAGGVGKTRLALEVATRSIDRFTDGVWFVDLAPTNAPAQVVETLTSALRLRDRPGRSPMETLIDHLRGSRVLIILDNCEHVIQACAELAHSLMAAGDQVRILATSREPLGVPGEMTWGVPPLSTPTDTSADMDDVANFEAVALLIERARQANPQLGQLDPGDLVAICRKLDGIPLALELAAAKLRTLSPAQLSARLDDRLRLDGGSRVSLPRQQNMRALIDWSHELLDAPDRILFRRLAIFASSFDVEAAERTCGWGDLNADDVLDGITRLVDKSMLQAVPSDNRMRYRLLETIRQYAMEKLLEHGEEEGTRDAHLSYFATMLVKDQITGPNPAAILAKIDQDFDNVTTALDWAHAVPQAAETEASMAVALGLYCESRGRLQEGRSRLERAASRRGASEGSRAAVLARAAHAAVLQSDYGSAVSLARQAISAAEAVGDLVVHSSAANALSHVARFRGDYLEADSMARLSLELAERSGDRAALGWPLNSVGIAAWFQGRYDEAERWYRKALEVFDETGYQRASAVILFNLGEIAWMRRDYEDARRQIESSIDILSKIGDRWFSAEAMSSLAEVARTQGDHRTAKAAAERGLTESREIGYRQGVASFLILLADLELGEGDLLQAGDRLAEALVIALALGYRPGLQDIYELSGVLAWRRQEFEFAIRLVSSADALGRAMGAADPPDIHLSRREQVLVECRHALGPSAFDAAWRAGQTSSENETAIIVESVLRERSR